MNWKKTFQVSNVFNILFLLAVVGLFILSALDISILFLVNLFVFFPLLIYFGYKARQKFNINSMEILKMIIPLILIMVLLFYASASIYYKSPYYIQVPFNYTFFIVVFGVFETIILFMFGSLFGYLLYPSIKDSSTRKYGLFIAYFILMFYLLYASGIIEFVIPTLNDNIKFDVHRQFSGSESGFLLYVETDKIYPCMNYYLRHNLEVNSRIIKVGLGDVSESSLCFTALGPASFTENLDLKDGNYTLEFVSANGMDSYHLIVDKTNISVSQIRSTFSTYENKQ
ncbi:MAG: hypothetical protein ABII22_06815 [Candidatus Micrarchaeota archaeon]